MNRQIKIFPSIDELNDFAAEKFVELADRYIDSTFQSFNVALAGGSTPKALYRLLASYEFRQRVNWNLVYFYFGDERNVPPTDENSNFRMANENLFQPLQISELHFKRWQTEYKNPPRIAELYNKQLIHSFTLADGSRKAGDNGFPVFDLILLGMGADGHTASLFPYTKALTETKRFAVANPVEKLDTTRLTMTFPVINNASNVMFLVAGEDKTETVRDVLEGEFQPDKLPSQNVNPANGNLFWLLDEKAAALLKQK